MKVFLIILVILVVGWDAAWSVLGVKPFSPWRHRDLMRLKQAGARLVDVRTPPEFRIFHIQGAENRPDVLYRPEALGSLDPDTPIVFICMTGHRSPVAAYRLRRQGFHKVYNLAGGMLAWKMTGGPTVNPAVP